MGVSLVSHHHVYTFPTAAATLSFSLTFTPGTLALFYWRSNLCFPRFFFYSFLLHSHIKSILWSHSSIYSKNIMVCTTSEGMIVSISSRSHLKQYYMYSIFVFSIITLHNPQCPITFGLSQARVLVPEATLRPTALHYLKEERVILVFPDLRLEGDSV